jgi:hypothetical protein
VKKFVFVNEKIKAWINEIKQMFMYENMKISDFDKNVIHKIEFNVFKAYEMNKFSILWSNLIKNLSWKFINGFMFNNGKYCLFCDKFSLFELNTERPKKYFAISLFLIIYINLIHIIHFNYEFAL